MIVSIIHNDTISYPDYDYFYSPDEKYPEYIFEHINPRPNVVYKAVRDCLAQTGLDNENYGKACWNPLKDVLNKGGKVFVLCNFVYHKRSLESRKDFFAKCTHGSVLRAVIDYILLAIGQSGKITFGNAPIQSCEWERILKDTGAAGVLEFYKIDGRFSVDAKDLRSYVVKRGILGGLNKVGNLSKQGEIAVDIGEHSLIEELNMLPRKPQYRNQDYDPSITNIFHDENKHIYIFSRQIFEADTIVSLAKLKTHAKAGVTLGIKNCIGGIAHKYCLPHYRRGCPAEGGDEYDNGQLLNRLESTLAEEANAKPHRGFNGLIRAMVFLIRKLIRVIFGRNVGGGWCGNDTTWRMSLDVARILMNTDESGKLVNCRRRKIIEFIDGIVAGEGDGPLSPRARHHGFLSYSDDIVAGDYVATYFMGLDPDKFPIIREAFFSGTYILTNTKRNEIEAVVNRLHHDHNMIKAIRITSFRLPLGWKKHVATKRNYTFD